jgi:hypothetical protein
MSMTARNLCRSLMASAAIGNCARALRAAAARLALIGGFGLAMAAAAPGAAAQDREAGAAQKLLLSTASTGGAFHQGGVSLSALIKLKLLPTRQIDLATVNSTGSLENIVRLRDGTSDFAIVQALLGRFARTGTGIAANLGAQPNLRAVTMLWPNVEHFIIRKDLVSSGTIADFLALDGRKVSLGREPSAIESNRVLLGHLGLDIATDVEQMPLSFRPSVAAFRRGEIDGLSLPASTPVPAFAELMAELGPDAVLLSWTEDQRRRADGGLGLWSAFDLPANSYAAQPEPLATIAQPNFLAVRADVDEEVVYAITRTVFENLPFLARLHAPYQFLTPETAVAGLPVPLHPGAARYYQEIGLNLGEAVVADNDYRLFGDDLPSPAAIRERVEHGVIKLMITEDDTSDLMLGDLLDVMSDDRDLRVLGIEGRGAAHNLADLLYLNGIDISVVQADALQHERERGVYPDLAGNIRYIAKWADAEVHLLARGDILDVSDLRDQPVNFGPEGSGSEITASLLFNRLKLPVRQVSESHGQALSKLKAGDIAGMVYVAPKPAPLLQSIEVRDGLRFLTLPETDAAGLYRPAELTMDDYPSLIFGEQRIGTLSVPLVLAAYNWPADHERYQPIARFVDGFLEHLDQLQDTSRHAKWQTVDPAFDLAGWQRHEIVEAFFRQLRTAEDVSGRGGPLTGTAVGRGVEPGPPPADAASATSVPNASPPSSRHQPVF